MRYGFINNFSQVLAADIAVDATNMLLDAGNTLFSDSSNTFNYVLTLDDGAGTIEIVHVFSLFEGNLYIQRAQEGTTAQAWPAGTTVEQRMTAVMASSFVLNEPSDDVHNNAVSIQPSRSVATQVASGTDSVAIGPDSTAAGSSGVAIGFQANAAASSSVVIGGLSDAPIAKATAVGYQAHVRDVGANNGAGTAYGYRAYCDGDDGIAIGAFANVVTATDRGLSVGWGATSNASYTVVIGNSAEALTASTSGIAIGGLTSIDGEGSIALGQAASTFGAGQMAMGPNAYPGTVVSAMSITAAPMVPNTLSAPLAYQHDVAMRMSVPMLVRSDDAALGTTGDKGNVTWPTGALFFIEAIDAVVISSAGGGATPTIDIGTTVSGTDILAAYSLASDVVGSRERVLNTPHGAGISAAHFSVSVAAASAVTVRFVLHGYMMES